METQSFVGHDGKTYEAKTTPDGPFAIRHDGRFWHISFAIADAPGWKQVYRGRKLPAAADHDRWVRYRPYPPGLKKRSI